MLSLALFLFANTHGDTEKNNCNFARSEPGRVAFDIMTLMVKEYNVTSLMIKNADEKID